MCFLGCQRLPKTASSGSEQSLSLPRELTTAVRELDQHQLRRLLILARGLLVGAMGPAEPVAPDGTPQHVTYRQERVRCGRAGCGSCPHGPYWYGYWKQDGRTHKQYIGRMLPGEQLEPVDPAVGVRPSAAQDGPRPVEHG